LQVLGYTGEDRFPIAALIRQEPVLLLSMVLVVYFGGEFCE